MGSPGVILTSQFTVPKAKSFTKYLDYMTRQEALLESEGKLTEEMRVELDKVQKAIQAFEMELNAVVGLDTSGGLTQKEAEAVTILKSPDYFNNDDEFEKYIGYMGRKYALESKKKKSTLEEQELRILNEKLASHSETEKEDKKKEHLALQHGVFSIDKQHMTAGDIEQVRKIMKEAQRNGSVFYQDVISFDTDFLIEHKIYDKETDELDENRLQQASRKMMDKMFEDEDINAGYWFASIHRNTDHIHIHYGSVEMKNTRKLIVLEENGVKTVAPKGKRKQQTIDNMKSTFTNSLIDRTAELSRISELRNTLVQDVKDIYGAEKEEDENLQLIREIYEELPTNKKHWQYGSKHLSNAAREKIDQLTFSLMEDDENFQEYISKVEEEGEFRKELFGASSRSDKNYASNKKKDIKKRLGNSLLKELKNDSLRAERIRGAYVDHIGTGGRLGDRKHKLQSGATVSVTETNIQKRTVKSENSRMYPNRINMYRLKRAINEDYQKYRAEREHEMLEQQIEREKAMQRL